MPNAPYNLPTQYDEPYQPSEPRPYYGPNIQNGWQQIRARMAQAMMGQGTQPNVPRAQNLAIYDPAAVNLQSMPNQFGGQGALGTMTGQPRGYGGRPGMPGTQAGTGENVQDWYGRHGVNVNSAYGVRY